MAGALTSRLRAAAASVSNSSSTRSRAGSACSICNASSRGDNRQDRGTNASPAFAQAKNSTTWSALLPVIVAIRSPIPYPLPRSRCARRDARSSSSR